MEIILHNAVSYNYNNILQDDQQFNEQNPKNTIIA